MQNGNASFDNIANKSFYWMQCIEHANQCLHSYIWKINFMHSVIALNINEVVLHNFRHLSNAIQ